MVGSIIDLSAIIAVPETRICFEARICLLDVDLYPYYVSIHLLKRLQSLTVLLLRGQHVPEVDRCE